jgi:hypothetical protein
MLRSLTISTFLLVGAVSVAQAADVFRWVDEHGGVHYSDQWVPGSEVIKSGKPRPASTGTDTAKHAPDAQKPAAGLTSSSSQQNAQAVKQDVAKIREQQCKDAKERYEKAVQARRIFKQTDGDKSTDADRPEDRQYLSDAEADAYRVKARQDVQDLCGNSTK